MPTHDYSAADALHLLLDKLRQANSALADRAELAINVGVDEQIEQEIRSGRGRGRASKRSYRKHRALTDTEAINAVLEVLEAHLVVHRMVVNSVINELEQAAVGSVHEDNLFEPEPTREIRVTVDSIGSEKTIEIELLSEFTQMPEGAEQTYLLNPIAESEVSDVAGLMEIVRQLTTFEN